MYNRNLILLLPLPTEAGFSFGEQAHINRNILLNQAMYELWEGKHIINMYTYVYIAKYFHIPLSSRGGF